MTKPIVLTEVDLHRIIQECLLEVYNKWFQTEENSFKQVKALINAVKPKLSNLDALTPNEVWEVVRQVGYINHNAFKVKSQELWNQFPDERLSFRDEILNKIIYTFKEKALKKLVDYYLSHNYNVAVDENRKVIAFREPTTNVRQITFHVGKESKLPQKIERNDAVWDGIKQAHHYADDDSYLEAKNKLKIQNS